MHQFATLFAQLSQPGQGPSAGAQIVSWAIQILMIVSGWKIFTKAGEAGWKSIIPIYSFIVLLKIVGRPWWWIFLCLLIIPIFIVVYDLAKCFGKGFGFFLGMIFLGFIFVPILAFGDAQYQKPA